MLWTTEIFYDWVKHENKKSLIVAMKISNSCNKKQINVPVSDQNYLQYCETNNFIIKEWAKIDKAINNSASLSIQT